MEKHYNYAQDDAGNVINGASVTIADADTGAAATVYADDETTVIGQPITTGATTSRGEYAFKAANGNYTVTVENGGTSWGYALTLYDQADDDTREWAQEQSATYVSGTEFLLSGDKTSTFHVDRRVKAQGGTTGTLYGTITASSYATNTTVTVAWDSGALVDEALTVWAGILSADNESFPATIVRKADNPARHDDLFADWVVSGLLPATSTTLTSDISAGAAYVTGRRIAKIASSHTYTASVDTYVDIDATGTYLFTEVATGGAAPAQPANSIRLAKVVTDATAITSVADLREKVPDSKTSAVLLQRAFASTGAVVSTTSIIAYDDSPPQITEGAEALSIAFTPKRADSRIRIRAVLQLRASVEDLVRTVAIFRAGVANSLGVGACYERGAAGEVGIDSVIAVADIGSPGAAAQTFSARFAAHKTGTMYLNADNTGSRRYGSAYASTLEVEEYMP